MEDCCRIDGARANAPQNCLRCGAPGRVVDRITVKALLRPHALARLSDPEHRFCPTANCSVVYFGAGETFDREDVTVPVFQKEAEGSRIVCYCFGITEAEIRADIERTGASRAAEHIAELVKAERCACEVKNPRGRCCLGNVAEVSAAISKDRPMAQPLWCEAADAE